MKRLCLLLALTFAPYAGAAFRCVDEKGRTHIGDTPPPGCANVVMHEVTRGGTIIRRIDPSMTEEQFKAKQEAEERQRIADKAAAEQKRKDTALLSTYATEKEFDVARDRNIEPVKARIALSNDRIKEIDKRLKQISEEMEFYKAGKKKGSARKDDMAQNFAAELERLAEEKKGLQKGMVADEKEIGETRAKFDVDKRRWVALKAGAGSKPADAPTAAVVDAKSEAKPVKKTY